jgi:PadR family transcriptional regulator PadR
MFNTRYFFLHSTWPCIVPLPYKTLVRTKYNNMNVENTQIQMRKGILEYCILQIVSRGEVYASDMLEELTSAKIMVVEGTLYPLLTRLRKSGLVEYKWVESNSGPPRKYYKLTGEGTSFLKSLGSTWNDLVKSTKHISSKRTKKSTTTKKQS